MPLLVDCCRAYATVGDDVHSHGFNLEEARQIATALADAISQVEEVNNGKENNESEPEVA